MSTSGGPRQPFWAPSPTLLHNSPLSSSSRSPVPRPTSCPRSNTRPLGIGSSKKGRSGPSCGRKGNGTTRSTTTFTVKVVVDLVVPLPFLPQDGPLLPFVDDPIPSGLVLLRGQDVGRGTGLLLLLESGELCSNVGLGAQNGWRGPPDVDIGVLSGGPLDHPSVVGDGVRHDGAGTLDVDPDVQDV